MNFDAIKDLIFRMADDELIIGHRNSEWTGLGPILEEDIAFSSMAQDEIGHAQAFFILMHEWMGEAAPDQVAFNRTAEQFRSSHLVEMPIGDYAFSLARHACYDLAEAVRLAHLKQSSFRPLAELAKKLSREEKYHELHAITWMRQLGNATEEANQRMQTALNEVYPIAFGLFEPTAAEAELVSEGILVSEEELEGKWKTEMDNLILSSGLTVPDVADKTLHYGGRQGKHTEYLAPMLSEMTEVFVIDPAAAW